MNNTIKELLENGIEVSMKWDDNLFEVYYTISGFYDRGDFSFYEHEDYLEGEHKEGITEYFYKLEDFVAYNYHCWDLYTHTPHCSDNVPDYRWKNLLVEFGYISEEVIPKTIYKGLK